MHVLLLTTVVMVLLLLVLSSLGVVVVDAFSTLAQPHRQLLFPLRRSASSPAFLPSSESTTTRLHAKKPMRLKENVDGVVYVNDKCIDCAACSGFAPATFRRTELTATTAARGNTAHVVYQQPDLNDAQALREARQALVACPVAAIRIETLAERRHRAATTSVEAKHAVEHDWTVQDEALVQKMTAKGDHGSYSSSSSASSLFPRRFLDEMDDVYWLGHHNEKSFGAIPYLLRTSTTKSDNGKNCDETIWIMIDTPRFSKSAVQAVESLTGPNGPHYLFLTHVDDTADHGKWATHYNNGNSTSLKRIFHAGDLGRNNWLGDLTLETVEVLLQPPVAENDRDNGDASAALTAYGLNGQQLPSNWQESNNITDKVVILHTPGHSPGSMTLYRRPSFDDKDGNSVVTPKPGILFTGDHYAYTMTRNGDGKRKMSGFPRYGNDLLLQAKTLEKFLHLNWQIIAPGHGHARDYRGDSSSSTSSKMQQKIAELRQAQEELRTYGRQRGW